MLTISHPPTPPLTEDDARLAEASGQALGQLLGTDEMSLENATLRVGVIPTDGGERGERTELPLPGAALPYLLSILRALGDGKGVAIVPTDTELTTQRAADFMHVSRPYVVKLLDRGEIPYRKVGPRRRVRLQDLLRYMEARGDAASQALDAMVTENQRLGLYP
jgi:excisionase family DNA binding protein